MGVNPEADRHQVVMVMDTHVGKLAHIYAQDMPGLRIVAQRRTINGETWIPPTRSPPSQLVNHGRPPSQAVHMPHNPNHPPSSYPTGQLGQCAACVRVSTPRLPLSPCGLDEPEGN